MYVYRKDWEKFEAQISAFLFRFEYEVLMREELLDWKSYFRLIDAMINYAFYWVDIIEDTIDNKTIIKIRNIIKPQIAVDKAKYLAKLN